MSDTETRTRKTLTLPVKLTDDEKRARGLELAKLHQEAKNVELEKKVVTQGAKQRLDEIKAKASILATAINEGKEDRLVECVEDIDFKTKRANTYRIDGVLWELVASRGLTREELQLTLTGPVPVPNLDPEDKETEEQPSRESVVFGGLAESLRKERESTEAPVTTSSSESTEAVTAGDVPTDPIPDGGKTFTQDPDTKEEPKTIFQIEPDRDDVGFSRTPDPLPDTPSTMPGAAVVEMKRGKRKSND